MDVATAGKAAVVSRQMHCSDEEHRFHEESSSSPEVPVALSSSTSSSSIASFSSGELGKVICSGVSRFRGVKEVLGSNGSLSKSYFLPPTAQREDSGIFASDDASTSEFSQSPSPDLLIGGGGGNVKVPFVATTQCSHHRLTYDFYPLNPNCRQCRRTAIWRVRRPQ